MAWLGMAIQFLSLRVREEFEKVVAAKQVPIWNYHIIVSPGWMTKGTQVEVRRGSGYDSD
jgi:hypothetical protein